MIYLSVCFVLGSVCVRQCVPWTGIAVGSSFFCVESEDVGRCFVVE